MRKLTTFTLTALVAVTAAAQAPTPNPANKTGVIGLMHAIHSTNDVEKTLAFYQSVFALNGQVRGFDPKGPRILTNSPTASLRVAMMNLTGHTGPSALNFELTQFGDLDRQTNKQPDSQDSGAPYRISSGVISGSPVRIEFIEVKGAPRKPFDLRVTDAMACGMAIRVGHIRDVLAKIKANGGRVLSKDETLVEWSDTLRNVFVKDPNGLNLELVGAADPNL